MKVKTRLSLLYLAITASILLIFAVWVFLSTAKNRENEFYHLLNKEAITKVNLLLNTQLDARTLQTIYRENREIISEVEVAIYDTAFNLLYHDAVDIDFVKETRSMIDQVIAEGEIRFEQDGWQVLGFLYFNHGKPHVVTAAAYDEHGHSKLKSLRNNLSITWLFSALILFIAGNYFSRKALKPISDMVDKVKTISATSLDLRLDEGNGKDEMAELAITFNQVLDRLESSFSSQKEFVSQIAHELRTPLTVISGEIELTLSRERTPGQYREALANLSADTRRLNRLIAGLLDLAKANYDQAGISMKPLRIEELLLDTRNALLKANSTYTIILYIDELSTGENGFSTRGNEYMLKVAFTNLMDNACKYSPDKTCEIKLERSNNQIFVHFQDKGIGIQDDDLVDIFKPFFRGKNQGVSGGNGIGLPLAQRVALLHGGGLTVISKVEEGSCFTISLPYLISYPTF